MLVDFLHKIYSSIEEKNSFLKKIKYYSFQRFIIRSFANITVPFLYKIIKSKSLNQNDKSKNNVIVSLTTFPARIDRIWIVIESILRQKEKPDKIILWLSKEQFENLNSLPNNLKKLTKKGLDIRFCEGNLRSHKKYYYAFKEYPSDVIITIDDDLLFPTTLVGDLMKLNKKHPKAIICNRAWRILKKEGDILPYSSWEFFKKGMEQPSGELFYTTGFGTLFPPNTLDIEVLNKEVFMEHCFYADDVWLNIIHQMSLVKVAKLKKNTLLPILNKNDIKLSTRNVYENLNDKQISNVREYFIKKEGKDPFESLLSNKN